MMMMNLIVVTLILSFSNAVANDPCRFEYPGKGVIDITTIGHSDGSAAFANQKQTNSTAYYMYSYNPCKPFTASFYCDKIAACQSTLDERASYTLGYQDTASWNPGGTSDDFPTITYSGVGRTSIVRLECSTNGSEAFIVEGENPAFTYTFRLVHRCACWNACSDTTSTTTTSTPTTTTSAPTTTTSASTTTTSISSACRFEHPEKGVIDFSFIGRTDEKAAYADETTRTTSNFKYSYNPCRSFSEGSGCIGVSVCQSKFVRQKYSLAYTSPSSLVSNDDQETFTLGTQESAWWDVESTINSLPSVNYVYGDKKVSVLLQCSNEENNEFQAYSEDPMNTFKFQLTHKCACWNGCSNK